MSLREREVTEGLTTWSWRLEDSNCLRGYEGWGGSEVEDRKCPGLRGDSWVEGRRKSPSSTGLEGRVDEGPRLCSNSN